MLDVLSSYLALFRWTFLNCNPPSLNAKIGYFDCFYYGSFDTIAFEHFKSLGFKIEEDYNPKDGDYFKISW